MKDAFSSFHPLINLLYFLLVLFCSMFFMHPLCLVISFTSAFTYSVYLSGKKALRWGAFFILPMLIITALVNPIFNHEGGTILTYLWDGNPLTLESILYGIAAALMLAAVISWFSCFNAVMTSDKLVYLFGRLIPALSLILSMTLRLVPRFKTQIKIISDAQKGIGRDISNGGILRRARQGLRILSILITWALENGVETADSMKGRGYGLPGRTAFSIFRFNRRDRIGLIFLISCAGYIMLGVLSRAWYFRYFPTVKGVSITPYTGSLFLVYTALCLMPLILNLREDFRWKAISSKI